MIGILGKKLGMTQIFNSEGNPVPVTVLQAGPCTVLQKKTEEADSYWAIQLGFDSKKEKNTVKPLLGHFKKAGTTPKKYIKELRIAPEEAENYEIGQQITVEIFERGELVDVTGYSIGKGYAGVVKRHGFKTVTQSHGTHEYFRHGGSIGSRFPQRTVKGRRMAGQLGNVRITVRNLEVFGTFQDQNLLLLKGAVPGATNGYLIIKKSLGKK